MLAPHCLQKPLERRPLRRLSEQPQDTVLGFRNTIKFEMERAVDRYRFRRHVIIE